MKKTVFTSLALLLAVVAAQAQSVPLSQPVLQQIQTLQAEKASRTPAQKKMDSRLVFELRQKQDPALASLASTLKAGVKIQSGGVLVDIDATVTQALLDRITAAGGTVLFSSVEFHSIRAIVALDKMEALAGGADVKFIGRAVPAMTRTGSVTSEGDVTHQAFLARNNFGADGTGVNVGVLSDSDDHMAQSQSTGDLPPVVTVLPGQDGVGEGEGTAMMEIVYDLAPGANLYFATAFNGPASFAQNILNLRAAGCDVICDDVFYFNESPFQDGPIAQAADRVAASGALYFSACGNEGSEAMNTSGTWEGDFMDGGAVAAPVDSKGGNYHMFGTNNYNTVLQMGMGTILVWSDPLGASTNDYDLYVLDATGATVLDFSTTTQNGTQDPFEMVAAPDVGQRIVVVKASGDPRFLHVDTIRGRLTVHTAGNVTGHPVATNVFAVAAVDAHTAFPSSFIAADSVETFSSDGPRKMFYQADGTPYTATNFLASGGIIRQKPDIAAADGVSTSVPFFAPFYGTSAAAPHAAAIAALLKSYNSDLTTDEIRALLTRTALDNMGPGVDINSGAGIIMPVPAIVAAPFPAPTPRLGYVTNVISGGNGNGMIDFDECNTMSVIVTNRGRAVATGVQGFLSSTTPGVFIAQGTVTFPDIPPSSLSSNRSTFQISTTPDFVCGTRVALQLVLVSDQASWTNRFQIATGVRGKAFSLDNNTPVDIPDADMNGVYSDITVSNFVGSLAKVAVSLYIPHTFDADLGMELIGPRGQHVLLSAYNGFGGNNYGVGCDSTRTTFDDEAIQSITSGSPPFAGSYKPEQPLSVFSGSINNAVNGRWRLHVWDAAPLDVGTIECWSLELTPIICTDGGGECNGSDLSITMKAAPNPAGVASPLTYTMVVSNAGPSTAKSAFLSQNLPTGCILGSVAMSQGTYTFDPVSSLLNANLGNISAGRAVTIVVTVIPTQPGVFISTATVDSLSDDPNTANNQAHVTVNVENAKADLSLNLTDSPDPVLAGGVLTYTMSVINNGPTAATNVFVTNTLPTTVDSVAVTVSQGSYLPVVAGNNTIVAQLGILESNATATITITCIPRVAGVITDSAIVVSDQLDPFPANNRGTVNTVVGPSADVAITLTGLPNPVAISNYVTYTVGVSNRGPIAASGLNLTFNAPAGLKIISSATSQGSLSTNQPGLIIGDLGTLPVGGVATVSVVVRTPGVPSALVASASVYAAQNDPDLSNNTISITNQALLPAVTIAAGTAVLTSESLRVDGVVEPGETVTANFQLKSVGTLAATNVVATLMTGGGVTQPSAQQAYGDMPAGASVSKPFTFTASSSASGTVTASVLVQSGANFYTNIFAFKMPSTVVASNAAPIVIPSVGKASPYPSTISVANMTGSVSKVTVTLVGLSHTYPHDISVLVVDPNNRATVVMAHVANFGNAVQSANVCFDDEAASYLPAEGDVIAGTFKPSIYGQVALFDGAPSGAYGTNLITFNGTSPNGLWSLYVVDDTLGDSGVIQGGWQLAITTISPVGKMADVAVTGFSPASSSLIGSYVTNWFAITNSGPDIARNVTVTNTLSPTLAYVGGSLGASSNSTQVVSLGAILAGSNVTVSVVAQVLTNGPFSDSFAAGSTEVDLNSSNNAVVLTGTGMRPNADLAVSITGTTNTVAGGDVFYDVVVVNNGPGTVSGVVLTNLLPAQATFESAAPSQGTVSTSLLTQGGVTNLVVRSQFGVIPAKASAMVRFAVTSMQSGLVTNQASVSSAIDDLVSSNNTFSFVTLISGPGAIIQAGNAHLVSETVKNGAIDPGETMVVELSLANTGTGPATNISARLMPHDGIIAAAGLGYPTVGESQVYGLIDKGSSVSRKFALTAGSVQGQPVVLDLVISNGSTQLPDVIYTFGVSGQSTYSSSVAIQIPESGPASPYPSSTNISGLTGVINHISVTIAGFTHAFPKDVSVALVGPNGQSVVLMSHAGGAYAVSNLSLTFNDQATAQLPLSSSLANGTYGTCGCGVNALFTGFPSTLSNAGFETFMGTDPNGLWSLYVYDDKRGDAGVILGGWTLSLGIVDYVNSISDMDVSVQAPHPAFADANLPYVITVTNFGPSTADNVTVTNTIPTDVMVVSATSSQGVPYTNTAGMVLCNFGSLPAGGVASMTTVIRTRGAEILVVSANVSSDSTDLNPTNNVAQSVIQTVTAVDSRLSAGYVKGGILQLTLTGQPLMSYAIEYSTNLTTWTVLSTNTVDSGGKVNVFDQNTTNAPYRFYRAIRLP